MMKSLLAILATYLICHPSIFAMVEIKEAKKPKDIHHGKVYLKLVADKNGNLLIADSPEIPSEQCDFKTKKVMVSLKDLTTAEIKNIKCNFGAGKMNFYYLEDFLTSLKSKNVKEIYLEPIIIPYIYQSTPTNREYAKLVDRFLRKNNLLEKSYIVSKSLKFLRVLKGQVNKEHKIIFRNGDSRPDYLHLALYYNLHGIMPHYQWVYDEDLNKIKNNDKKAIEIILWGDISPYIKQDLLKKPANGILVTQ